MELRGVIPNTGQQFSARYLPAALFIEQPHKLRLELAFGVEGLFQIADSRAATLGVCVGFGR